MKKSDTLHKWMKKTKRGDRWFFHRKAGNGEIIFCSQGYKTRSGRNKAVNRIIESEPKVRIA
jgi:uncharacterized protein YegP (UPF0339 family)